MSDKPCRPDLENTFGPKGYDLNRELRQRIADLEQKLKQAESERDVTTAVNKYNAEQYEQERNELQGQLAEAQENAESVRIAIVEFYNDWQKGDFNLPRLAQLDFKSVMDSAGLLDESVAAAIDRAQEKK